MDLAGGDEVYSELVFIECGEDICEESVTKRFSVRMNVQDENGVFDGDGCGALASVLEGGVCQS